MVCTRAQSLANQSPHDQKPVLGSKAPQALGSTSVIATQPLPDSTPKQAIEQSTHLPSSKRKRSHDQDTSDCAVARLPKRLREYIAFWANKSYWPQQFFDQDPKMNRLLAKKKSSASLRSHNRKRSEPVFGTSATPSDQRPREEKVAPYHDLRYKKLLETKGSFMEDSVLGITDESHDTYRTLLISKRAVPSNTLFQDATFKGTCRSVEDRNEARVMRDITPLLVPSAEILAIHGASELGCLIDSINEGWNNSFPLTTTRPQPDYSVGFRREAFTEEQLKKLSPFVGNWLAGDQSFFMATYLMYFPFLVCEVKCGAAALDIADRQNAHSATLAVRAIVELLRLVKREDEVNRQILAFSFSHDHQSIRIYGHYPEIQDKEIKYYRHVIRKFDFTELEGKEKWTAYSFTNNIYHEWMPKHFERICSAIDQLPSHLDFDVPSTEETDLS